MNVIQVANLIKIIMNTTKFLILFISFSILLLGCSKKTTTVTNEKAEKSMETQKRTMVLISTNYGDIKIALYNETPQHRDNFIQIVSISAFDENFPIIEDGHDTDIFLSDIHLQFLKALTEEELQKNNRGKFEEKH